MGSSIKNSAVLIENRMMAAATGDKDALCELGLAYSSGTLGVGIDLIQAHKWFNLAALNGDIRGQGYRHDVSEEMSARQIAEAQRQARSWLQSTTRLAA